MTQLQQRSRAFDLAPLPAPPLLDSIDIDFGPRPLLARYMTRAVAEAERAGVRLVLYRGMAELAQINREASGWSPLNPIFEHDPAHPDLERSFSIVGYADDGDAVATTAARLVLAITTLKEEAESLRLFYPHESSRPQAGERCLWQCPKADGLSGRIMWSGAEYHRPDYRGRGLSRILPRLARAIAYAHWGIAYAAGFVRYPEHYERKLGLAYGFPNSEPLVRWLGSKLGDIDSALCWMDETELLADLETGLRDRKARLPEAAD